MIIIILIISVIALIAGAFYLSEATAGVGIIAIAGVLAVYVRLMQADEHHKEIKRLLGEVPPEKPPSQLELQRILEEKEAKRSDS
jgi:hypothetical protein